MATVTLATLFPAVQTTAATASGNLVVSVLVVDTCLIAVPTPLAFVDIASSGAVQEAVPGIVAVTCTSSKASVSVTLGAGSNYDSAGSTRRMADGSGNYVPYALHSDSSHLNAIASGGTLYSGPVTAAIPTLLNVYGQIPGSNYTAGAYLDTVVVTLTY